MDTKKAQKQRKQEDKAFAELESALGDYKILNKRGEGTYGYVIKAIHKKSNAKVALKIITIVDNNPMLLQSVLREIQIMRQLSEMKENRHTTKLLDLIVH